MATRRLGGPIYGEMAEEIPKIEDFPELIAAGFKRVPPWYGHSDDHLFRSKVRIEESDLMEAQERARGATEARDEGRSPSAS